MNKKGQLGFELLKPVVVIVLVLIVLGVIFVVVAFTLTDMDVLKTSTSASTSNETLTTVTETGEYLTVSNYRDVVCTVGIVTNATGGGTIPAGNYTVSNCNLLYSGDEAGFNNSNWNVSYTYVYNADGEETQFKGNATSGLTAFFSRIPTIMTILAVVIIITAVTLILRQVGMFSKAGGV